LNSPLTPPSCIFFTTSAELRALAGKLEAAGAIELVSVTHAAVELLEGVRDHLPDLVFADLGQLPETVLDLLEKLPAPRPRLLLTGPQDRSGPILRAMRMGVREYFDKAPSEEELLRAIRRVGSEVTSEPDERRPARVIVVMGAKGGVGATVVACQLAASLRRRGGLTALVDLNLPLGDVALQFDLQPAYTLAHIGKESERLDATFLRTLLQGPRDGVQILAAPIRAEEAELVRGPQVERVIALLRDDFEWVVLDVSRTWSEPTMRALDLADQILLVTHMDVPTLHHTRQHIEILERMGHTGRRIRLVANRYSKNDAVTDKDVATFLGRAPDFRIPNDYRTTMASVHKGIPIAEFAPRSGLAQAYAELAQTLHHWCEVEEPVEPSGGSLSRVVRGMFRRS
jgi:pilus assembly protein CpaE